MTESIGLALALVALVLWALSAVKQTFAIQSTVIETLPAANAPFGSSGKTSITHDGLNVARTVDANSPAGQNVKLVSQGVLTMTAGAVTLNLAAAPGTVAAVDHTGQKIRTVTLQADAANLNNITIAKGAANGYTGLGAAFSLTLAPGKSVTVECDPAINVAAGVRTLDISGTGAQKLNVIITSGDN